MIVVLAGGSWVGWQDGNSLIWAVLAAAAALAVVSFWDDRRSLSWRVRMGFQALAAAFVVTELAWSSFALHGPAVALIATVALAFVFVGYANAFNFMDGINGIAGGQALVTGLGTASVAIAVGASVGHPAILLSLLIVGAAAGFLPHNFPRAKMFMGDVGSVPCGFLLAVLAAWLARDFGWWLLVPLGLLHANFIMDTAITVVRRVLRGERWHDAHREHFYQRLIRAGWSHTAVTGCEMGLQVLVLGVVLLGVMRGESSIAWMAPVVVSVWLGFFGFCESQFRRRTADRG
jgi:UDP-N-acetylmuramyl pentapeptide phosphotransferase/UDP-N-acetylglucosamine-1-phosphate transferase